VKVYNILIIALLLVGVFVGMTSSAQAQEFTVSCPGAPTPRLMAGQSGRVTPGLPNALRNVPGRGWNSVVLAWIPANATFSIPSGYAPSCADGMYWWYVNYNGTYGWTPEGSNYGQYWTEPVGVIDPNYCAHTPHIINPGLAQLPAYMSQALRTTPGGNESTVVGYVPNNGVVNVMLGYASQCAQGMWWHYVSYQSINAWLPEGVPGNWWLNSYGGSTTCGVTSRLLVGNWARVTPGLPNNLRSAPTIGSARIGMIPAGNVFQITYGPVCADGITWWQVQYNGLTGWTGEGRWGTYWIEPF
jgi:hypothetical protein